MAEPALVARLSREVPLTAASFIVTVYGDVVVPRGEVLWMGSLIEVCARVGISENLVRTAVSRLVAAGQLTGERQGRRSFYRLAPTARTEFAAATARLYTATARPDGWCLLSLGDVTDDIRRRFHMASVGGGCWLAPDWGTLPEGAIPIMRVPDASPEAMPGIAGFWDLGALEKRYEAVLACFRPVVDAFAAGNQLGPPDALSLRLLLVHAYRGAVLRDPFLPQALLPPDWPGTRARALFGDLYLRLTPEAEREIATLQDATGTLCARTVESLRQIAGLR